MLSNLSLRLVIRSNRESGYGRYDVMMIPRIADLPAVILEFMLFSSKRGEKALEDTAANALKQFVTNNGMDVV